LTSYVSQSEEVDTALKWKLKQATVSYVPGNPNSVWTADTVAKKLLAAKNGTRVTAMLLAGERKANLVQRRLVDRQLQESMIRDLESLY
jgi:hypothetical protein